jgi:hypothetical protein
MGIYLPHDRENEEHTAVIYSDRHLPSADVDAEGYTCGTEYIDDS